MKESHDELLADAIRDFHHNCNPERNDPKNIFRIKTKNGRLPHRLNKKHH